MVLLLVAMLLGQVGLAAVPASAAAWPAYLTGVRLAAATSTSFTVTANRSTNATGYRIYASLTKSDVYVVNLHKARRSTTVAAPRVTFNAPSYSTGTWWYRMAALNSSGQRYTEILSTNLRPAMPTATVVRSRSTGTSITWASGPALRFRIAQATNAAMTQNRVNYTTSSQARQFTPYGLRQGVRYYFRLAAVNVTTSSTYVPLVSAVVVHREQPLRVMTYNVLSADTAGVLSGDGPLAPWSQRRAGVLRLIKAAAPDLVALQEGNGFVGSVKGFGGVRQADDIAAALSYPGVGSGYALARTEVPPTEHQYFRTGRYILYKKSVYALSGTGGHWNIGTSTAPRYAAYQVLIHRTSRARFLFVSAHLNYEAGVARDHQRQAESVSLIRQATAYAAARQLPVIYAGDFNSHEGSNHVFDGPGIAFRAVRHTDAFEVAQQRVNPRYNSSNQNFRTPPQYGRSVDHIFAPPGVALRTWQVWLELSAGRFVGPIPSDHNPVTADVTVPVTDVS